MILSIWKYSKKTNTLILDEIAMKFQSVDLNNGPLEHDYRPPISRQNSMNGGRFSRQNSSRSDEMWSGWN